MNTATIKRNVLLWLISGVFALSPCSARTLSTDSLKTELSKAKNDTNKINLLVQICAQGGQTTTEERLKYANEALALATQLNYAKGKAKAMQMQGIYENDIGKYDEGLLILEKALSISPANDKALLSSIYNSIAGAYYYKGDYTAALKNYLKSLENTSIEDKKGTAATEFNISLIYFQNQNFAEAEKYVLRAKTTWEQLRDTVAIANALGQLGNIYYTEKEFPQALACYSKSQTMAEKFTDKSYQIVNLLGMSNIYKEMGQNAKAIDYCKRALAVGMEVDDRRSMVNSYQNLGVIYSMDKNYAAAIEEYKKGAAIAVEVGSKYDEKEIYNNLAEAYSQQNNYKEALKYQQMYSDLNDTLFNEENSQQLNEMSAKYESEKKEKEIAVLNLQLLTKAKDQEVLNAMIQKRSFILYGTTTGSVLLILSLALLFNRRRLLLRNAYQMEMTKQQENTATAIVQAQENERTRIARDLHDSVGTYLSTLKLNLQLYEPMIPQENANGYHGALQLIDKTAVELRNIMKNLSNETLQEQGLVSAFEELTTRVNALGSTRFDFLSDGMDERPDSMIELSLYRIAQELLVNCVKYAKAGHATLQLIADELSVTLMLEDNGIGFDPDKPVLKNADHGMGIKNIRDRVNFIKGLMRIESGPTGTVFVIEVPKR